MGSKFGVRATEIFIRLFALAVVFLSIVGVEHTSVGARADQIVFDVSNRLWPAEFWENQPSEESVVVLVDDRSLATLGRWPWSRSTHAEVIHWLTQAQSKVVVYNVAFIEPDQTETSSDALLRQAMAEHGKVVLPLIPAYENYELYPFGTSNLSGVTLGHVHLEADSDGYFRRVFLRAGSGQPQWPLLALAAYGLADPGASKKPSVLPGTQSPFSAISFQGLWSRDLEVLVPLRGLNAALETYSFVDVLRGRISSDEFKGKTVFVGITAAGFEQKFPTRFGRDAKHLSGTDIQASVYNNLHAGTLLTPASSGVSAYLGVFFAVCTMLLLLISYRAIFIQRMGLFLLFVCLCMIPYSAIYTGKWVNIIPALTGTALSLFFYSLLYVRHLNFLARRDKLTGLPNRRMFDETCFEEWNCAISQKKPISLLMLDIDFYKQFNDEFGHAHGDWALVRIASYFLKYSRRARDLPARYGGEEFAIILPDTDERGAHKLAVSICADIEALQIVHPKSTVSKFLTISVGTATMRPEAKQSLELLLERADKALYQAKTNGRNRVEAFSDDLSRS